MNTAVTYRGYDGSILHDHEDHLYHGKILGLRDFVIYHGSTPEEAEAIFRNAVDDYLSHFQRTGKTPPQPFATWPEHLPHELRVKAALFAEEHDVEAEAVIRMALTQFLDRAA